LFKSFTRKLIISQFSQKEITDFFSKEKQNKQKTKLEKGGTK